MDPRKTAVVLLQLGGPDSPDAVEPFLHNLFSDPDIIDIPGLVRKPLARYIAKSRAPRVAKLYDRIGGKSPILEQTTIQARALENYFRSRNESVSVHIAMRYWHPFTDEVIRDLEKAHVQRIILLPLYPQYSKASTGSSFHEFNRSLRHHHLDGVIPVRAIQNYYDHPLYIASLVDRIKEALSEFPAGISDTINIVFSAHGTPIKLVRSGDPYSEQIRKTFSLAARTFEHTHPLTLCFQSKVGPQRWLGPSLIDTIVRLGWEGVQLALVVPIAFVSDHLETLSEISIEARELAERHGIQTLKMTKPILDHPKFIQCLGELALNAMKDGNGTTN